MKIGVGVITCNRINFFEKCISSIPREKIDELVVVNDSEIALNSNYAPGAYMIHSGQLGSKGVGVAKNKALQYLIEKECDYIFLIEDDMLIKRSDIFDAYINASKETGIHHWLFAYHGPANKNGISGGKPCPRVTLEYKSGLKVNLNQHCVGAFCMYTKESLEKVGLFDDQFSNAFEHVHHSYLMCKNDYCTEYWWWPDLENSLDYIEEQACSEHNSSIRPRKDWSDNIRKGFDRFIELEGISPIAIPDKQFSEVKLKLKSLSKHD